MGSFNPVAAVLGGFDLANDLSKAKSERARQNAEAASVENRRQQLIASQQSAEDKRRAALKAEQASARARFGARGLTAVGGSGQAVLEGLAQRAEDEIAAEKASLAYGLGGLDYEQEKNRQRALLQRQNSSQANLQSLLQFSKR